MSFSESSAEAVASNTDLLMEILARLPVKNLFRLKSVSKPWLHLISTPYFARLHTLTTPKPSNSVVLSYRIPVDHHIQGHDNCWTWNLWQEDEEDEEVVEDESPLFVMYDPRRCSSGLTCSREPFFDFLKLTPTYHTDLVVSSCNGLLLCYTQGDPDTYVVVNPVTNVSKPLPTIAPDNNLGAHCMTLAFDPSELSYWVVCAWLKKDTTKPEDSTLGIIIYSTETGSWSLVWREHLDLVPAMIYEDGMYWNGGIHYCRNYGTYSAYFSMRDKTMKTLQMPRALAAIRNRSRKLGQSWGRLNLVEYYSCVWATGTIIDVYDLRADYSGWNHLCRMVVDSIAIQTVIAVVRDEDDEDLIQVVCWAGSSGMVSCNPMKQTIISLMEEDDHLLSKRFYWNDEAVQFSATLAPI